VRRVAGGLEAAQGLFLGRALQWEGEGTHAHLVRGSLRPLPLCAPRPAGPLAGAAAPPGPPPGHLSLPAAPLGASDDQHLFELALRLQHGCDDRLLLPALSELAGSAAADFPAEALLQRRSLLVGGAGQTHARAGQRASPPRRCSSRCLVTLPK
jgi:hypothetical protein